MTSPSCFIFFDLFRNSHLGMEPELFWSLAFGPVNALIRFHLDKGNIYTRETFVITGDNLRRLFEMVTTGFL
ncbi:MAG TPA: hypothetical protein VGN00_20035 [Puia sp.]